MVDGVVGSNIEFLQFSETANGFLLGDVQQQKNKRVIQQKKYIINTKKNLLIRSFFNRRFFNLCFKNSQGCHKRKFEEFNKSFLGGKSRTSEKGGSGEVHSPFREISRFFEKPTLKTLVYILIFFSPSSYSNLHILPLTYSNFVQNTFLNI